VLEKKRRVATHSLTVPTKMSARQSPFVAIARAQKQAMIVSCFWTQ